VSSRLLETAKRAVRIVDARVTPNRRHLELGDARFRVYRPHWWDNTDPTVFRGEIAQYFEALPARGTWRTVVDAGAATGLFAIPFAMIHRECSIHALEPSRRQRILLRRNVALNGIGHRVAVDGHALWRSDARLSFRTHGELSAIEDVSQLPGHLPYGEQVLATSLDRFAAHRGSGFRIDLVKMDIEGAEIEALEGARQVLRDHRPVWLIQAYHLRDGEQTFARCRALLERSGYTCRAAAGHPGLLVACPEGDAREGALDASRA